MQGRTANPMKAHTYEYVTELDLLDNAEDGRFSTLLLWKTMGLLKNRRFVVGFIYLLIVWASGPALAQVADDVAPMNSVYHAIDVFNAHGLIDKIIMGQRPYSRLEVARMLTHIRQQLNQVKQKDNTQHWSEYKKNMDTYDYIHTLLSFYEMQYDAEINALLHGIKISPIKYLDLFTNYNGAKERDMFTDFGLGPINGKVSSFDRFQEGISYEKGNNTFIRTSHDFRIGRYFVGHAEPLFQMKTPQGEDTIALAQLHKGYIKTGYRNIELLVGRGSIFWGQDEQGGVMLSNHARPLDMIRISNPTPIYLPWFLKHLGAMKWTFFLSNLGPDSVKPYTYFYGLKWSSQISRYIEMGLSHTVMVGGDGAPNISFLNAMLEIFPVHKWERNADVSNNSNHATGFFDLRITVPQLRGISFYYDAYVEDSITRAFGNMDNLMHQMSFVTGVYMPRLSADGQWGARFEYRHLSPDSYLHGTWTDGYTLNKLSLGDPMGPGADGYYLTFYWRPFPRLIMRVSGAYESFDSSHYIVESKSGTSIDRIFLDQERTHENHYRIEGKVGLEGKGRLALRVHLGFEHVSNREFVQGNTANHIYAGLGMRISMDDIFPVKK